MRDIILYPASRRVVRRQNSAKTERFVIVWGYMATLGAIAVIATLALQHCT